MSESVYMCACVKKSDSFISALCKYHTIYFSCEFFYWQYRNKNFQLSIVSYTLDFAAIGGEVDFFGDAFCCGLTSKYY
jgi:hypothetical protein